MRDKYAETTRQTLIDTGRRLFTERDFSTLSAEEIVREAGLTRGALYHHFDGKKGLFEAVFVEHEAEASRRIGVAVDGGSDILDAVDRGISEFLSVCSEPAYLRIVLQQGPIALGWARWREIDQGYLGDVVVSSVQALIGDGIIAPYPPELLVSVYYGALTELSMTIADSEDRDRARVDAMEIIRKMIGGLIVQPDQSEN
ncbi:putative TetR family transcriptional regulator [Gordonia soli NBRC 108243]|uniref:Putative TetR family transcriptional regulator n=1 Tax=Gordonia soli NBRC 108243 TaxID=1223545 RepID=M0QIJ1_9ACTN|nr:putative TetR family transcriptional regulator [Gordonia soli NBRC 108243]